MANSDYNVIYLDDDGRNAVRATTQNHRPPVATGNRAIMVPASNRPTLVAQRPTYAAPTYAAPPATQVYYHPPAQTSVAGILGGITAADLAELVPLGIAVLRPLPDAPPAQGDVETDVENLILYQSALAVHAKRDEQIRAIGTLLGRLTGARG